MCIVCQTIVIRSGHGHVYWLVIEIVMVADNIDVMRARAERGDHWKLQKHSEQGIFQRGDNLIVFDTFERPNVL